MSFDGLYAENPRVRQAVRSKKRWQQQQYQLTFNANDLHSYISRVMNDGGQRIQVQLNFARRARRARMS